jgi:hypothetical protein
MDSLKRFFVMYFVGHEVMSQTVSGLEPEDPTWGEWLEHDKSDEVGKKSLIN